MGHSSRSRGNPRDGLKPARWRVQIAPDGTHPKCLTKGPRTAMRYHPRSPKARSMFLFHGAGPKIVRHVLFGACPEIMRLSLIFFSAWLAGALYVFLHAECIPRRRVRRRVVCCMYFYWRAAPRIVRHALLGVGREGACVVCVPLRVAYRRVTCFPCRLVRRRVACFPQRVARRCVVCFPDA